MNTSIEKALFSVPWDVIAAIDRPCGNRVPTAIQKMSSNDLAMQQEGYLMLDNFIIIQGGLFAGSFYALPFLLHLLSSKDINNAPFIYDIVIEMCTGNASHKDEISFQIVNENGFEYYIPQKTGAKRMPLQIACRNLISSFFSVYLEEALSNAKQSRLKAIELLSLFIEYPYTTVGALREIQNTVTDTHLSEEIEKEVKYILDIH